MITRMEIQETNRMISEANLDVRTITMGISLLDCAAGGLERFCGEIYDKITRAAERLVRAGDDIALQFGIPVVNKRISVTPVAQAAAGLRRREGGAREEDFVEIAKTLDRAAREVGVNFIGGFSALVQKGSTASDLALTHAIPRALAETERVCSSVNLGSTRAGINMNAVARMGRVIKETAARTAENGSMGCAKLVVFCNAVEDNPFMAGAFHGAGERDLVINVGVSGPGVVKRALEEVRGADFETVCETVKRTAFKITRVGQLVALEASKRLGVPFGIIDLSLAPTPAVGDSIAEILQEMGLAQPGAPGTTAALAMLNDNVKKGGVMASSYVGGLSGAFIPVSEDHGMVEAARLGALTLEKLEAMTCVCSVGLDMIAVPGDTSAETIAGIIADEMAIGMINGKTTAVRIIPAAGKRVGELVELGGLLGTAPVMPVNGYSCEAFIKRGGRIPPPIHSFRN
ncbi:MAG: PFL family protein [Oscillospiraceae bacterium]|nr:PFL family protein [Oscillospiraceae bacterium]